MKKYKINGKDYQIVPNMTVARFGDLTDYFDKMVDEKGQVSLDLIRDFTKDSQKMTELVSLALVPVEEYGFLAHIIGKNRFKLKDLKHITLDQFIEVIIDFFGLSGPLQTAFLTALSQLPQSIPMHSTVSEQK